MLRNFTLDEQRLIMSDPMFILAPSSSFTYLDKGFILLGVNASNMMGEVVISSAPFSSVSIDYYRKLFDSNNLPQEEVNKLRDDHEAATKGWPEAEYGVCDYPYQITERWPSLVISPRNFIITLDEVRKDEQIASKAGWRWHKNGEYIGDKNPVCEYLADEPVIENVYMFHIHELPPIEDGSN